MKLWVSLCLTALMYLPAFGSAGHLPFYEDCSWKCKKIPPIENSYQFWNQASDQSIRSASFELLVWNVYKGREKEFFDDYTRLAQSSDISVLQETNYDKNMSEAYNAVDGHEFHMAISFLMKKDVPTGVTTSSRVVPEIAVPQRTRHREPFSKSPKMNLVTIYPMDNGQRLLVINIHGINFKDSEALVEQLQLAEGYLSSHIGPVIFAGDFNTKNDEKLEATDNYLAQFGLSRMTFENDKRKKKLDSVYSRGLEVRRKALLTDLGGSDHPAIVVEFSSLTP